MKVIFRVSILLNVVFLGFWAAHPFKPRAIVAEGSPVAVPSLSASVTNLPLMAAPMPAPAAPAPFRWSQLDAKDYHVYVKNLRAIGCPEPSVRAIVTADVQAVYDLRQRRLEQKLVELKRGSWSAQLGSLNAVQAVQADLQEIPGEMTALVNDLLGLPSPAAAGPVTDRNSLPLALQEMDLTGLKMDAGQLEAVNEVRQAFLNKVGGTPPDANDAAAVERWQKARADSDDQLQGFLGSEAYQNLELQAFANSQAGKSGQQ